MSFWGSTLVVVQRPVVEKPKTIIEEKQPRQRKQPKPKRIFIQPRQDLTAPVVTQSTSTPPKQRINVFLDGEHEQDSGSNSAEPSGGSGDLVRGPEDTASVPEQSQ